jgi:zinc-binding alcohol dehydrogenase/oxidoreductase
MQALVLHTLHQNPVLTEVTAPKAKRGEVIVQIKAAALNHRDLFIIKGLYANIQLPAILGSDGAGAYNGQRVLIYPALEWGNSAVAQGKNFRVLGMPEQGTFADQISVSRSHIYRMPEHLSWAQGAALPLAGLTAWRTLMSRCKLKSGERVLITGIGGGVALMAMQFALAAGAEVWVTSGSTEKIARACEMGAKGGLNYREEGWDKALRQKAGTFDVVIDSAAGDGFALLPGLCNMGARIGVYGGTLGKINGFSLQPIFWKQISIHGATMGSSREFKAMLQFVDQHKIIPVVDAIYPMSAAHEAFDLMEQGGQFGKIVLTQNP